MKHSFLPVIARFLAVLTGVFFTQSAWSQATPDAPGVWSIVATYSIPGKASGLAYDGTYLYFGIYGANGQNVHRFDPATGNVTLQCTGPFDDSYGMTYKSPNLVTIKQPSSSSQPAQAIEFSLSGSQISALTLPNHYMSGIAYDNGSYWVCTYYPDPGTVYHVNSSGTVLSQFTPPANQPWDICMQGSDLWIADYNANMLYKVTTTGTVLESHPSQILKPSGVVFDGSYLWYCAGELSSGSTLYKVDLSGSGTPVINVPVTSHNYGTVTVGTSSTWNCQVQNTGSATLTIQSLGITAGTGISTTMTFPVNVAPGGSVNIPLTYTPSATGALNTSVYVNTNDPVTPSVTLQLTGNGVSGGPGIGVADTIHDWGNRRKGSFSRWFLSIQNTGNQDLVISGLTTSDTTFVIDPSVSLPITLIPLQMVQIGIWFNPVDGITYEEQLSVISNDPLHNPLIVHLKGTGVNAKYPVGTLLWSYMISGSFDTSPKGIRPIGDITGDGVDDVIVASEDNHIRCFNGNSSGIADLMWATEIYSGNVYQQNAINIIEDIDNDGFDDVVIGTTGGDRSVRALSGKTGQPLWRYDTHAFGDGGWVYQVDARYDYNDDGKPDVLACAGDDGNNTGPRRVFCLNGLTGNPIWICPTEGAVFSVLSVDDFNGDGKRDVVAGATNASQGQSRVYGINGANGAILWTNIPMGSSTWALIQIDDFTGDGIRDIATGDYSGNIYFHNVVTGNREKTTLVQSAALMLRFEDMGDVNKDGHPDFIIGHSGAKAVVINGHDASILWQQPLSDKSWNVTNMGDITWDGTNDCAVGTLYVDNRTYFLDGTDGDILYSAIGNTPVDALDAIPDIVGDQSMELVVGGRNGGVVCLSGGYDTTLTAIITRSSDPDNQPVITPNPCDQYFQAGLMTTAGSPITFELTDLSGQILFSRRDVPVAGGYQLFTFHRSEISANTLPAGVYILKVNISDRKLQGKVVFR